MHFKKHFIFLTDQWAPRSTLSNNTSNGSRSSRLLIFLCLIRRKLSNAYAWLIPSFSTAINRLSVVNAHVRKTLIWNPLRMRSARMYHLHGAKNFEHSFDQWMFNAPKYRRHEFTWQQNDCTERNKKADDLRTRPPKVSFASCRRTQAKLKKMNYIN